MRLKKIDQTIRKFNHKRIDFFRSLRFKVFKLFFNQKNFTAQSVDPQEIIDVSKKTKSVLILRLDGKLGDTVAFSGFLKALNQRGYKVTIITLKSNSEIYQWLPGDYRLITVSKSLLKVLGLCLRLKPQSFDVLISSSHILSLEALILSRFLQAQKKIGFLNRELLFFDDFIENQFFSSHITEKWATVLDIVLKNQTKTKTGAGIEISDLIRECQNYQIQLNLEDVKSVLSYLQRIKKQESQKIIILNVFAGAHLRSFSLESLREILEIIKKTDHQDALVILIGSSADLRILRDWKKREPVFFGPNILISEEGRLGFNLALIRECDLVITPDTSIVHIASTFNKKILAFYREDLGLEKNYSMWKPVSSQSFIVFTDAQNVNVFNKDLLEKTLQKIKL